MSKLYTEGNWKSVFTGVIVVLFSLFLVVLNLKGNAKPFAYQSANGVAIISAEDGGVRVVICKDGKPIEVVPLEMVDTLTVECNKEAL
jgi:hypothetical protein